MNARRPAAAVVVGALLPALFVMSAVGAAPALAGPITAVNACHFPLNHPGDYQLTTDLGPVPTTCLVVTAPHVTLDLDGHTVMGTGTAVGIAVAPGAAQAKMESTAPGAAVGGFSIGILDDANYAVITGPNLTVGGNTSTGVHVLDNTGSFVQKLVVTNNQDWGVHIQHSGGATVRDNNVSGTARGYGIWVATSGGTQVVANQVTGSHIAGIYLGCSGTGNLQEAGCGATAKSLVSRNVLTSNGDYGIAVEQNSWGNMVRYNHASGDSANDLQDENFHCTSSLGTNQWQGNTGTRNQTASPTCIG